MKIKELKCNLDISESDGKTRVIMTGTQVYGPVKADSDYDVVMMEDHARALMELLILLKKPRRFYRKRATTNCRKKSRSESG